MFLQTRSETGSATTLTMKKHCICSSRMEKCHLITMQLKVHYGVSVFISISRNWSIRLMVQNQVLWSTALFRQQRQTIWTNSLPYISFLKSFLEKNKKIFHHLGVIRPHQIREGVKNPSALWKMNSQHSEVPHSEERHVFRRHDSSCHKEEKRTAKIQNRFIWSRWWALVVGVSMCSIMILP